MQSPAEQDEQANGAPNIRMYRKDFEQWYVENTHMLPRNIPKCVVRYIWVCGQESKQAS